MISKAKNVCDERFPLCMPFAKTYDVYIKTRCESKMSKMLIYEIDKSLDKRNVILEC